MSVYDFLFKPGVNGFIENIVFPRDEQNYNIFNHEISTILC